MDIVLAWKGAVLGFSIAAPVGPIGILCIRRTLAKGRRAGFASGLGAAAADLVYGAIAAFGITAVSNLLVRQQGAIRTVGGLFLCYLGSRLFVARPSEGRERDAGFGATFVLTLANPMTILSFAAVFAGLGLAARSGSAADGALLVAGVFAGSCAWWLLLSAAADRFRTRITGAKMRWVNRASGVLVAAFGVAALLG
jgi:threonine/homoserine/homoserine lactone efflux protein